MSALVLTLTPAVGYSQSAFGQLQQMAGGSIGNIPEVPEPTCAACNVKGGHASGCIYYGGGGSTDDSSSPAPVDITQSPIFVAPVGIVGGVFVGGAWYVCEMAGKYPNTGFLKSYHQFLSADSDDQRFDSAWNFGTHIGGLPWLALYLPTWPLRQGIVAGCKAITTPSPKPPKPPKPPDPRIAVHEVIAKNYAQLRQATDVELQKITQDVKTSEWRRQQFLDAFIEDHSDLRKLRKEKGIEMARAKAQLRLDAWSKSRAEKEKIAATVSAGVREKTAFCRAAIDKASAGGFLADLYLYRKEADLTERLKDATLPKEVSDSMKRELSATKILANCKTTVDIGGNLKDLWESRKKSRDEGKDFSEWWEKEETTEQLLRLDLKLLPLLTKTSAIGLAASGAESAMDGAYAIATSVAYHDQLDAERALLNKLGTARVFEDAAADDWDRVNVALEAAREREKVVQRRRDQYEKMQKENENHANRLRS